MSDASQFALPYAERKIGDATVRFAKLSAVDRAKLLRLWKQQKRDEFEKSVGTLDAEKAYIERRTFDSEIWGASKWVQFVNDQDGAVEVLRASLAKYHPAEVDSILAALSLPQNDELRLLSEISNLPFNEAAPRVPNMVQVGVMNGKPVYQPIDDAPVAEGSDPNSPAPEKRGYGT